MHKIDFSQTFPRIVKLLHKIGVWHNGEESACRKVARKSVFLLYFNLIQIFIATSAYLAHDKSESIFLVQMVIVIFVLTIKLCYLLWKKNEILTLYERTKCFTDNQKMKKFVKFVNGYFFMLGVAAVFFIESTLPIFSSVKTLPFYIRFRYTGKYSEMIYWAAYVFVGSSIFFCNIFNLITPLLWRIMLSYTLEYEALGNNLKNLGAKKVLRTSPSKNKSLKIQNVLLQNVMRENVLPQNVSPQNVLTRNLLPKNVLPQNVLRKNILFQNWLRENVQELIGLIKVHQDLFE